MKKEENLWLKLQSLPEQKRTALWQIIENYELAEAICKGAPLTPKERDYYKECAQKQGDTFFWLLLLFEEIINKDIP